MESVYHVSHNLTPSPAGLPSKAEHRQGALIPAEHFVAKTGKWVQS